MAREDKLDRRKTKLFNSKEIPLGQSGGIFETSGCQTLAILRR
jgi:hypothetical protein